MMVVKKEEGRFAVIDWPKSYRDQKWICGGDNGATVHYPTHPDVRQQLPTHFADFGEGTDTTGRE